MATAAPTFENARFALFDKHMDRWTFGTVMRDCTIPDATEPSGPGGGDASPYFHGVCQEAVGNQSRRGGGGGGGSRSSRRRIWFSKKGRSRRQIRIGPATFDVTAARTIPMQGDVLVGECVANDGNRRGHRYMYWHCDAKPLFELRRLFEHGTTSTEQRHRRTLRILRRARNSNGREQAPSPPQQQQQQQQSGGGARVACDDLFALVSLVLYGNVERFAEQHRGHLETRDQLVFHDEHMTPAQFVFDVSRYYEEPTMWDKFREFVPDADDHVVRRPESKRKFAPEEDEDGGGLRVAPLRKRQQREPDDDDDEYLMPSATPATSWNDALATGGTTSWSQNGAAAATTHSWSLAPPAPAQAPATNDGNNQHSWSLAPPAPAQMATTNDGNNQHSWSLAPPAPAQTAGASSNSGEADLMRMLNALSGVQEDDDDDNLMGTTRCTTPPPPQPEDVDIYSGLTGGTDFAPTVPEPSGDTPSDTPSDNTPSGEQDTAAAVDTTPPTSGDDSLPSSWFDTAAQEQWKYAENLPVTDERGVAQLRFRYTQLETGATLECDCDPETSKRRYPPMWKRKLVTLDRLRQCASIRRIVATDDAGRRGTLDILK